jgi:hypothetical protein
MSRLAREKNRSAWRWSLLGVAVWLGAEFTVSFGFGIAYAIGSFLWGWPEEITAGVRFLAYIAALIAALISVEIVHRILRSRGTPPQTPLPPPPPKFDDATA